MKKAFGVWGWSATVLAHSLASLILLAAFLGLWALAAYEWLWIPESSALVLMLSLVWAIAQVGIAAAVITGTITNAMEVADANGRAIVLVSLVRIGGKRFIETLLWLAAATTIGLVLAEIFSWVNRHSVEVASFLSFHSERPVSYSVIEKCLMAIEGLIWIAVAGLLVGLLMVLFRNGWQRAHKQFGKDPVASCFGVQFLSGFLSAAVFGGLASLLANWRPTVTAGFWDYSQLSARLVVVLTLVSAGLLFWLLCLARLNSPTAIQSCAPGK
jgi:hypothetical protein